MDILPKEPMLPEKAYQIILERLKQDADPQKNIETFITAEMEEYANKLYAKYYWKNLIDKSENPQTTAIENGCWKIIADLWHCKNVDNAIGFSTVGSSEACIMAGLAMKRRCEGLTGKSKPNLVMSTTAHVCWKKFCNYFDVEPRYAPISQHHKVLDGYSILSLVDDNTIGVVVTLGITYTGQYDDIVSVNQVLNDMSEQQNIDIPIHVDAASGGMIAPFLQSNFGWDFRIKRVVSINTSGHKYGLVYPGIGWVVWRHRSYFPKSLIHYVDYLGGHMPTNTLNFTRPGAQVLLQYWVFIRYGFDGIKAIHEMSMRIAYYLMDEILKIGVFQLWAGRIDIPIVTWTLQEKKNWTLFNLSDRMSLKGWMIPAYAMPDNLSNIVLQRVVIRNDMTLDLINQFLNDLKFEIKVLNA